MARVAPASFGSGFRLTYRRRTVSVVSQYENNDVPWKLIGLDERYNCSRITKSVVWEEIENVANHSLVGHSTHTPHRYEAGEFMRKTERGTRPVPYGLKRWPWPITDS